MPPDATLRRVCLTVLLALGPALSASEAWQAAYAHWDFASVAEDNGFVAPVARDLTRLDEDPDAKAAFDELSARLAVWHESSASSPLPRRLAACLNAAALVDMGRGQCEAEFNHHVFAILVAGHPAPDLAAACTRLIENGPAEAARVRLPALGLSVELDPSDIQERMALLARKLLGRALGRLPRRD